jgi:hypothetical protein
MSTSLGEGTAGRGSGRRFPQGGAIVRRERFAPVGRMARGVGDEAHMQAVAAHLGGDVKAGQDRLRREVVTVSSRRWAGGILLETTGDG